MNELIKQGWALIRVSSVGQVWGSEEWVRDNKHMTFYCGKHITPNDIMVSMWCDDSTNTIVRMEDWKAINTRMIELEKMISG